MADVVALRPLGVGDILDEAFRIYRRNFGYLVLIGVASFGPIALLIALLSGLGALVGGPAGLAIGIFLGGLLGGIGGAILIAAMIYAVGGICRGRRPTIREALGRAVGRLPAMLGLTIVLIFALVLLLITIVGWIWAGVLWSMAFPILVLEEGGVMRALARSRQLVRGSWWRVFGILLLIWLISLFISLVVGTIGGLVSGALLIAGPGPAVGVARLVVQLVFNVAAQALTQPFDVAGLVLIYYDLRVRKEGLDLQQRAESLLAADAPAASPLGHRPRSGFPGEG